MHVKLYCTLYSQPYVGLTAIRNRIRSLFWFFCSYYCIRLSQSTINCPRWTQPSSPLHLSCKRKTAQAYGIIAENRPDFFCPDAIRHYVPVVRFRAFRSRSVESTGGRTVSVWKLSSSSQGFISPDHYNHFSQSRIVFMFGKMYYNGKCSKGLNHAATAAAFIDPP